MYKKILIIFLIFLISGCSKEKPKTKTVIEYDDDVKIAINYPITNIRKVDNYISNYIDNVYNEFKNNNDEIKSKELNISYSYDLIDNYISITLTSFISVNTEAHPTNEVYTIVYDKNKNKVLTLGNLINDNLLKSEIPKLKKQLIEKYKSCLILERIDSKINTDLKNYNLFSIDKNNINIFFNPYEITNGSCNIISLTIPFKNNSKIEEVIEIVPNIIDFDLEKPAIALTFDDGPSVYTKKIIKLLKKYDAVGTFFIIGNKVEQYKDTLKLMYEYGNEIGNHSYDHKWLTKLNDDDLSEEINKTQNIIKTITGFTPKLFRPTYGSVNNRLKKDINLDFIMWDIDTRDWEIKDYKKIASKTLSSIKDGDIIIMHDIHERTYKALEIILPKLKKQGFQFVTVSQLKELKDVIN